MKTEQQHYDQYLLSMLEFELEAIRKTSNLITTRIADIQANPNPNEYNTQLELMALQGVTKVVVSRLKTIETKVSEIRNRQNT